MHFYLFDHSSVLDDNIKQVMKESVERKLHKIHSKIEQVDVTVKKNNSSYECIFELKVKGIPCIVGRADNYSSLVALNKACDRAYKIMKKNKDRLNMNSRLLNPIHGYISNKIA